MKTKQFNCDTFQTNEATGNILNMDPGRRKSALVDFMDLVYVLLIVTSMIFKVTNLPY